MEDKDWNDMTPQEQCNAITEVAHETERFLRAAAELGYLTRTTTEEGKPAVMFTAKYQALGDSAPAQDQFADEVYARMAYNDALDASLDRRQSEH